MGSVYLKSLGYQHQEIGRIMGIGQRALRRYLRMYQAGGIEGLKALNFYRPKSEMDKHREQLKAEFEARPAKSINEAVQRIEKLTRIRRCPTQVGKFLKDLGVRRLKVGHIPAKADPQKQKVFLEEELEPRLAEARQGKRHVFFVDAAHFVMRPFLGFLWCFVRHFIQAPSGRQRFNVLGALHATTLQVVTVTNASYILFWQIMGKVTMDNARYQSCRFVMDLAKALGIELLFLPPYSPNLNLIERLWKFIKKKCLYSEYYEEFTDFKQAIVGCITETDALYKQELTSLLTLKFQTFENVPL